MNYIKQLEQENKELRNKFLELNQAIIELETYYMSPKFHGITNDYAHVSTDILTRLSELKKLIP